jgi:hypothetical protein
MTNNRRSRKVQKRHYRRSRRHGGDPLRGAPVDYSLAGSWPSKMSLGQGTDFFQYHKGQHGGDQLIQPAPLSAIEDCMLPQNLRASAHVGGLDAAIKYASQFKDQAGGRRTRRRSHRGKHRHSRRCHHGGKRKQRKSQRHQRKHRKSRGGAELEYAPFPSKGMLLNDQMYAQAGLNPSWKNDVAYVDAKIRDSQ